MLRLTPLTRGRISGETRPNIARYKRLDRAIGLRSNSTRSVIGYILFMGWFMVRILYNYS
jgi:hypothetical protein